MSDQVKVTFGATGTSDVFETARGEVPMYYITGFGTGSVRLEVQIAGDWIPASAAVTSSMATVAEPFTGFTKHARAWRLNCTAYTSGDIVGYIG